MCGRFTLTAPGDVIAEFFDLVSAPDVEPRYNIAPTQQVGVIRHDRDSGRRQFSEMHWGLIPSWAKDRSIGSRMINARAETVATKPSFRDSFARRRCLIVADGFYEWQRVEGRTRKQPHLIRLRNGSAFGFAGLWTRWRGDQGAEVNSCTILTTEPNELIRTLHDRMPVIIDPNDFSQWLDPGVEGIHLPRRLFSPYPATEMETVAVETTVNNVSHDGPACIEPL